MSEEKGKVQVQEEVNENKSEYTLLETPEAYVIAAFVKTPTMQFDVRDAIKNGKRTKESVIQYTDSENLQGSDYEYNMKIKMPVENPEVQEFMTKIGELVDTSEKEALANNPSRKKYIKKVLPFHEEVFSDEEAAKVAGKQVGDETGFIIMNFSTKFRVPQFNAKGERIPEEAMIDLDKESKLVVGFKAKDYFTAKDEAGITKYPAYIQLIDAKERQRGDYQLKDRSSSVDTSNIPF